MLRFQALCSGDELLFPTGTVHLLDTLLRKLTKISQKVLRVLQVFAPSPLAEYHLPAGRQVASGGLNPVSKTLVKFFVLAITYFSPYGVSSVLQRLTSLFGMGRGVTTALNHQDKRFHCFGTGHASLELPEQNVRTILRLNAKLVGMAGL